MQVRSLKAPDLFSFYRKVGTNWAQTSSHTDILSQLDIINTYDMLFIGGILDAFGYIIIGLCFWLAFEAIFYFLHQGQLNDKQVQRLSRIRRKRYIHQNYSFTPLSVIVDQQFKSSLAAKGKLYVIDEPLHTFPSKAGALLKGKKHEWVLLAFVRENKVERLWANKGPDRNSVGLLLDIEEALKLCKQNKYCTLMLFHNHPNPNPQQQNRLLASSADIEHAQYCSNRVGPHGINWLDFVCERGRFLMYHKTFSELFVPEPALIHSIQAENNLSAYKNYRLHRELFYGSFII